MRGLLCNRGHHIWYYCDADVVKCRYCATTGKADPKNFWHVIDIQPGEKK